MRKWTYICPRAPQVNNLGAAVAVLLEARALEAVEGVRDALAAADDALVLVVAEAALVADADERRRADVRVADGALAVALVAEAADGDAGLLAAHDEVAAVWGVSRRGSCFLSSLPVVSLGREGEEERERRRMGVNLRVMAGHGGL